MGGCEMRTGEMIHACIKHEQIAIVCVFVGCGIGVCVWCGSKSQMVGRVCDRDGVSASTYTYIHER
jgi:hypothetical protein